MKHRLVWSINKHPGSTSRPDGTWLIADWSHPVWVFTCHIEQWSETENDWIVPDDLDLNLTDGFIIDTAEPDQPDATDTWPYTEAENRLLAKVGLNRDQLTEIVTPW